MMNIKAPSRLTIGIGLILLTVFVLAGCGPAEQRVPQTELEERGGLVYKKGDTQPFTGTGVESQGKTTKKETQYENGKLRQTKVSYYDDPEIVWGSYMLFLFVGVAIFTYLPRKLMDMVEENWRFKKTIFYRHSSKFYILLLIFFIACLAAMMAIENPLMVQGLQSGFGEELRRQIRMAEEASRYSTRPGRTLFSSAGAAVAPIAFLFAIKFLIIGRFIVLLRDRYWNELEAKPLIIGLVLFYSLYILKMLLESAGIIPPFDLIRDTGLFPNGTLTPKLIFHGVCWFLILLWIRF